MRILSSYRRPCLVGIGGVSMSALAEMLHSFGFAVFGCDWTESPRTRRLETLGIPVAIGPGAAGHIDGADVVIRTAAAHDDAPEITAARAAGIPVLERAAAWADVMDGYGHILCISGSHGKSTTTGMCAQIGLAAGLDPTVAIGADLSSIGGNLHIGSKNLFVAEADEYYNSFLSFSPTVAVINNIEVDHLDFFRDLDHILSSFARFAALVPPEGCVAANGESENVARALENYRGALLRFGLGPDMDVRALDIELKDGGAAFTLMMRGRDCGRIRLRLPGLHNVYNALGAAAGALACGIPEAAIMEGLENFRGVGRRFEIRGRVQGALVVDDYAHHPTELRSTLEAARAMGFARILCAFQPHTYSRTKTLFDDFAAALRLADVVALPDIYAAREQNVWGVTSGDLAAAIPGSVYTRGLAETADFLRRTAREGDLVLIMGAGSVTEICDMLLKETV